MPELPEVETLRRSLEPGLVGRRVLAANLLRRDILVIPGDPAGGFSRARSGARPARFEPTDLLQGAIISALHRRGKQLAIAGDSGRVLVVHLGMSGQMRLIPDPADPLPKHTHATWRLSTGLLVFRDPRRFGGLWSLPSAAALNDRWTTLGPDAASITADQLAAAARTSARPIKALLLDQAAIAGVGNIYADEALFLARISPRRLARRLKEPQIAALAEAIRQTLAAAIAARGSTLRDYADAAGRAGEAQLAHRVYDRAGEPCPCCGCPLRGTRLAQRATVYCPACQR